MLLSAASAGLLIVSRLKSAQPAHGPGHELEPLIDTGFYRFDKMDIDDPEITAALHD